VSCCMESIVAGAQIHDVKLFPDLLNTLPHVAYLQKSGFNKLGYRSLHNVLS
jgi:hypothetical protein